eukprot:TRINITY_DN11239_c0_g1_i2.p1 TRINITY_DN11239_c0_g1~~TRINITY_DN11239_c0_g1_i2.p1  ORF type:complete len:528 (+),score=67.81 TRINITY_DN11239_c0_g1_i2:331-1914(+)
MIEEAYGIPKVRAMVVSGITCANFDELVAVFKACEDIGDEKALVYIARIVAGLFRLAAPDLVFLLLSEKKLKHVIAMLERHPKRPYTPHRAILHATELQNPLNLTSELQSLLKHIHTMSYFRDACLPLDMDEVSSEVVSNQVELTKNNTIQWIIGESSRLQELFEKIDPLNPDHPGLVKFVLEMLQEAKTMPLDFRDDLLVKFCKAGLVPALHRLMTDGNDEDLDPYIMKQTDPERAQRVSPETLRDVSTIVFMVTNYNVNLLRREVLADPGVFTAFVNQLIFEVEVGFRSQWQDVVSVLLDTTIARGLGKIKIDGGVASGEFCMEFINGASEGMDRLLMPLKKHKLVGQNDDEDDDSAARPYDGFFARDVARVDTALTSVAPVIAYYLGECEEGALWGTHHQVLSLTIKLLSHPTTTLSNRLLPCVWILKGSLVSPSAPLAIAALDPFPHLVPYLLRENLASSAVFSFLQAILETCSVPLIELVNSKYLKFIKNAAIVEGFQNHSALREAQRTDTAEAGLLEGLYD